MDQGLFCYPLRQELYQQKIIDHSEDNDLSRKIGLTYVSHWDPKLAMQLLDT